MTSNGVDSIGTNGFSSRVRFNRKLCICGCYSIIFSIILIATIWSVVWMICNLTESNIRATEKDALIPPNPEYQSPPSYTHLHLFKSAAVCSDSEICSKIGKDILFKNGSVVDATIATMFCAGITNMQSMGIGGGFIMNVFIQKDKKAYTLDAREIAAGNAHEEMHLHDPRTTNEGPLSIAIPGEMKGYWEAHKKFGQLTWKELVEPTIEICRNGFEMTKHMEDSIKINPIIVHDEQLKKIFFNQTTGEQYNMGHIIKLEKLCDTLQIIASEGGDSFYNGRLADMIAEDLKDLKSIVTRNDLTEYKIRFTDSMVFDINGKKLYVTPPPGSGILIGFIMNILKGYKMDKQSLDTMENSILTHHRIVEAYKFTYGKRTEIGDIEFNNIDNLISDLMSEQYAENIRQQINDSTTYNSSAHYGSQFDQGTQHGTAQISLLASNGDACSVTSSVNFYFGAGLTGKRTGIIFNSGMDDFSSPGLKNYFGLPGSKPNFIKPYKRALSSMTPVIVTNERGTVEMVIGAAGGTKIPTAVSMAIIRYLWFGSTIKEAIDAARFHHQLIPNEVQYEFGNPESLIKGFESKGHKTSRYRIRGSIICGITKNKTGVYGNADYRKGGDLHGF